jgi:hypothetical protein
VALCYLHSLCFCRQTLSLPLAPSPAGQNWENVGWKVQVSFTQLANKVRPKDHIDVLRPFLPNRYSPLQSNGNGLQSIYLTEVPTTLSEVLMGLIGDEVAPVAIAARDVQPVSADDLDFWERKLEQELINDSTVQETDRLAIIRARYGQGLFKDRVSRWRAAIATEKKPLLIGHYAPSAILCFNRGDCFDTALLGMGNAALREKPYAQRCTARRL